MEKPEFCCQRFEREMADRPYEKHSYIQDGKGRIRFYLVKNAKGEWDKIDKCPYCEKEVY